MSNFSITFDMINADKARAFVNGVSVGMVRKRAGRVIFRCSRNPGSNIVRSTDDIRNFETRDYTDVPMSEIIDSSELKPALYSIILRNAVRNYSIPDMPI